MERRLALITPTRNRARAFALCEQYISRQTFKQFDWLVCNDGTEAYIYNCNQIVIQRDTTKDTRHSLLHNYATLVACCFDYDTIVPIEDDDWYCPTYVEQMVALLKDCPLAGFAPAVYWNVQHRRWWNLKNSNHCSLAATGFTSELWPTMRLACDRDSVYLDMFLWQHWRGTLRQRSIIVSNDPPRHVGIKGVAGERNASQGGRAKLGAGDPHGSVLREWIGEDVSHYL